MDYDIASVWVVRPRYAYSSWLGVGVKVVQESSYWGNGPLLWEIASGSMRLSRANRAFVMPSGLGDWTKEEWDDIRWTSLDEALAFAKSFIPQWEQMESERVAMVATKRNANANANANATRL